MLLGGTGNMKSNQGNSITLNHYQLNLELYQYCHSVEYRDHVPKSEFLNYQRKIGKLSSLSLGPLHYLNKEYKLWQ